MTGFIFWNRLLWILRYVALLGITTEYTNACLRPACRFAGIHGRKKISRTTAAFRLTESHGKNLYIRI